MHFKKDLILVLIGIGVLSLGAYWTINTYKLTQDDSKSPLVAQVVSVTPPALTLSPATRSVTVGGTFSEEIRLNTGGQSVVAVAAQLTYDTNLLRVSSINTTGSAFSIAAEESSSGSTIRITRGSIAPGVTNTDAYVGQVVFEALQAGTASVAISLTSAGQGPSRIVANDGNGTDVIRSTRGATITISSASSPSPAPAPSGGGGGGGGGSSSGGGGGSTATPPSGVSTPTTGGRVQTTSNLSVRSSSSPTAPLVAVKPAGSIGTIISGPVSAGGFAWVQVRYDDGTVGWSAQNWLRSTTPTVTTPVSTGGSTVSSNRVRTRSNLSVRSSSSPTASLIAVKPAGSAATVIGGPVVSGGFTWLQVRYDDGTVGWSAQDWLVPDTGTATTPALDPAVRQALIQSIQQQLVILQQRLLELLRAQGQQ